MTTTQFWREWSRCQRCLLHKHRQNVVIGEGPLPADYLLVGEAPGRSEDVTGRPFIGPSGKILRALVEESFGQLPQKLTLYITNIIACIPYQNDDPRTDKNRQPREEEATACRDRLVWILQRAEPKGILLLGKIAEKYFPTKQATQPILALPHPSFILRRGGKNSSEFHETRIAIKEFVTGELHLGKKG